MKRCPYCAEEIQDDAIRCRYCQSDLTTPIPAPDEQPAVAGAVPVGEPAPSPRNNGMAIASMVLGILWLYGIGSLLAIILGIISKNEIDRSNGEQGGRGLAIVGIVLGSIGLVLTVIGTVLLIALLPRLIDTAERFISDPVTTANLTTALATAEQATLETDDFSSADAAWFESGDPAHTYTSGPSTDPETISFAVSSQGREDDTITLAARSKYGVCFSVRVTLTPKGGRQSTTYGRRVGTPCVASALTPTDTGWDLGSLT